MKENLEDSIKMLASESSLKLKLSYQASRISL